MQLWFRSSDPQLNAERTAPCGAWRFTAYQLGTIRSAGLAKLTALAWPMTAMLAAAWRFGTTVEFSAGRSASARHRISDRLYVSSRPVERKQYVSNSASSVGQMPFT